MIDDIIDLIIKTAIRSSGPCGKDGVKEMECIITRSSIINKCNKDGKLHLLLLAKEKTCEEAYIKELLDSNGNVCSRYFIDLDTIVDLDKPGKKYDVDVLVTENLDFSGYIALVLYDEEIRGCFMKSHGDYVSKNTETYDVMLKFFSHEFSDSDQSKYERNCLDEFLLRIDQSSNILDMACGVGKLTDYIYKKGFDVEGCDLSMVLLSAAKANNPYINFTQDDIRKYIPQKKFNAVVLSYCLFHFTNEDIKRILNNICIFTSGHAVVHIVVYIGDRHEGFIKDPINEDEDIKKLVDNERDGRPFETYVNLMSEEQFCDLIKACNYEIVAKHIYHCEKGIGFSDRILFLDVMRKG